MLYVICLDNEPKLLANIMRLKGGLTNIIEPDFGLLDLLLSSQVLNRGQLAKVRSQSTVYERNDAMLDLLVSEDQCDKFLVALQRTGQQHVVNYITENGGQTHFIILLSKNVHLFIFRITQLTVNRC